MPFVERKDWDPVPGFRYAVRIQGLDAAWFTECSGLTIERKTVPHEEGGLNAYVHQLPDRITQSRITLKRGIADRELWKWFVGKDDIGLWESKVEPRNLSIVLYNVDRSEAQRWNIERAYPVKWSGPTFKPEGTEVAVETLELVHHGLHLAT